MEKAVIKPEDILEGLTVFFKTDHKDEKRIEGILIPTDEHLSLLEDYLTKWAWELVQCDSEPEDSDEESSRLGMRDLVIELMLYGAAYLAKYRNEHPKEVVWSQGDMRDDTIPKPPEFGTPVDMKDNIAEVTSEECESSDVSEEELEAK